MSSHTSTPRYEITVTRDVAADPEPSTRWSAPSRRWSFVTSAPSRSTWTYTFEPIPTGTRVTESMRKDEEQPLPIRVLQRLVGVTDRTTHLRDGMVTTLERLDAAATAP